MPEPKEPKPGMPPTPDDANRDVIDFEKLDLNSFIFLRRREKEFEQESRRISIGKEQFDFRVRHHVERHADGIEFIIRSSGSDLSLILKFHNWGDGNGDCRSEINRDGKQDPIPEGIGMKLYRKGLLYIQQRAQELSLKIKHKIIRGGRMDANKWHKYFDPIIEEYAYKKVEGFEQWEKTYEPQK